MNEIAHELAKRLQEAHKNYIYWYRALRTANDGLGLHHVTEQFSSTMLDTFEPAELYDVAYPGCKTYVAVVDNLIMWARQNLQEVIIYRDRPMALCIDDYGQQYAIVYKGEAHCWPSLRDCFASIDAVIDYEIYHEPVGGEQ